MNTFAHGTQCIGAVPAGYHHPPTNIDSEDKQKCTV